MDPTAKLIIQFYFITFHESCSDRLQMDIRGFVLKDFFHGDWKKETILSQKIKLCQLIFGPIYEPSQQEFYPPQLAVVTLVQSPNCT